MTTGVLKKNIKCHLKGKSLEVECHFIWHSTCCSSFVGEILIVHTSLNGYAPTLAWRLQRQHSPVNAGTDKICFIMNWICSMLQETMRKTRRKSTEMGGPHPSLTVDSGWGRRQKQIIMQPPSMTRVTQLWNSFQHGPLASNKANLTPHSTLVS